MADPFEHRSRVDRRRVRDKARARRRRNATIATALCMAAAVCLGVGGFFIYRHVARSKPPEPEVFRVTLPEGLTIKQTARKVAAQTEGTITASEFEAAAKSSGYDYGFLEGSNGNLEGFLFPKTYEVTDEDTTRDVVVMMLDQFGKETGALDWARAQAYGLTRYDVLIIASMVEKEAKVPQERPIIASVIYNRLKAGMRLQIDATVQYALGAWKPELCYSDLEVDSPYNTYRVSGLPPGPICNPGFESIRAALHPEPTEYLYYILTSPEGRHSFTADYQQFVRWKEEQAGGP
ncbi:MAG: endolytic transglycosylase MltG [Actinobacteria bacterium]|nr:endolytic transglycosylase MltG [Actinomycetota bacterium]